MDLTLRPAWTTQPDPVCRASADLTVAPCLGSHTWSMQLLALPRYNTKVQQRQRAQVGLETGPLGQLYEQPRLT